MVSPRFGEGSGLKQQAGAHTTQPQEVSPRFGEGSGLKLAERSGPYAHGGGLPSLR